MVARLDVRRAYEIDAAWIDDDELRAFAQSPLHSRGEHRMPIGRVRTNHDEDIRLGDRVEVLGARRSAESGLEAVARRRVADPRAGVDVVVAERGTHHLLHEEGLLVGAARGSHGAHRVFAVLLLQATEIEGDAADGLVPGRLAPRIADALAHERREHPVRVGRVAPSEASLDAGVAAVGLAVVMGDHAHDLVAAYLRLEAAAHSAIRAGGEHRSFRLTDLDHGLFDERRGRARLDAGTAGDALGVNEFLVDARRDLGLEAAAGDRERKRPLHLVAGAHAARADDALGRIEGEVRVRFVFYGLEMVGAVVAIAHLAQADRARHVLQLAVAVRRTGEAIERMIGDVELHDAATQGLELAGLRAHLHAFGDRRGARGRRACAAFDLDEAQATGSERLEGVGGAELRYRDARFGGCSHDRGPRRHRDGHAVDLERDGLGGVRWRRAEVAFEDGAHCLWKSCGK